MNKTQLVDALAERLGDRRTAANAVDGLLDTIVATVRGGDSVSIVGFGVFEGRARAARTARNPRTGEPIAVPAATVPAFRPGAGFRNAVSGGGSPAPRRAPARAAAAATDAPVEAAAAKPAKKAAKPKKAKTAAAETAAKPAAAKPAKSAAAAKPAASKSAAAKPAKGGKADAKPAKSAAAGKPKAKK